MRPSSGGRKSPTPKFTQKIGTPLVSGPRFSQKIGTPLSTPKPSKTPKRPR